MALRYIDIYRIPVKNFVRRGKKYLTMNQVQELLTGTIEVEEKLDGKRVQMPLEGYTLFKEDCKRAHTVHYMTLPAWKICFDVWDNDCERFLSREEKVDALEILGIPMAPMLFWGEIKTLQPLIDLIGSPSAFGAERIEGIVIKNPEKQLFGKIVDPLFDQEVDDSEHHIRRPYEMNRLTITGEYVNV